MISNTKVVQSVAPPVVVAGALAALPQELGQSLPTSFVLSGFGHTVAPISTPTHSVPAQLTFPRFGFIWPTVIQAIRLQLAAPECLILRLEFDGGVTLRWEITAPLENGQGAMVEQAWKITLNSSSPRAHFVAATLHALLLLDQQANLIASELDLKAHITVNDALAQVSGFLQRRQLAYRLMLIEKAFKQNFIIPQFISRDERSTVDFVHRAIIDNSFAWPFTQESYPFVANEPTRELLFAMNGVAPLRLEFDRFQQSFLGKTLHLGKVNLAIQNAVLVNPTKVQRELQQLDGHSFEVLIQSLSGAASYEFLETPSLPNTHWDELIKPLIGLENQLDNFYFNAVNRLAIGSIDEETAQEQARLLTPLSFVFGTNE